MVGLSGLHSVSIVDDRSVDSPSVGIRVVLADHLLYVDFLEGADLVDESVYVGRACCGGTGVAVVGAGGARSRRRRSTRR